MKKIVLREFEQSQKKIDSIEISVADERKKLTNVAKSLDDIANKLREGGDYLDSKVAPIHLASAIKLIIKNRNLRSSLFQHDIFSDPAWDMLLDLTLARLEDRRISVSSLCLAANVPTTTGLRWIKQLIEFNLVNRRSDLNDARRSFVEIEDDSYARMVGYLLKTLRPRQVIEPGIAIGLIL